ncbi:MAG: hypothetical protein EAZ91_01170 [Cytophagales bacterium]|nr:MAG: hypothetical protein EAZ91_01170 [Cytophagales bacterium]
MHQLRLSRLLTYALLFFLPLAMANCGGKNGDDAISPASIEGNWKLTAMKVNPGLDAGPFGKITDMLKFFTDLTGSTCLTDITFTFKKDGTSTADTPKSCQGNTEDIEDQSGIDITGTSKWALVGDQLTLTDSDGTKQVVTAKINGNTMSWTYKDKFEDSKGVASSHDISIEYKRAQ